MSKNFIFYTAACFAAGIAAYFLWPFEPVIYRPFLIAFLLAMCFVRTRFAILLFAFGFFYACGFSQNFGMPAIRRDLHNVEVSGIVRDIDYILEKTRVYIGSYRLNLPKEAKVDIGDEIIAVASLFRPNPADIPGEFDFAEWAYFNGVSATGYISEIRAIKHEERFHLRSWLHEKYKSPLSDALVLGYKNNFDSDVWKRVGIAHVFSISGFHLTLVGGWLLFIFCIVLKSFSWLVRRMPAKIPATIFAWFGLLLYLSVSGSGVATMRSFLMASVAFAAFCLGRDVFSLRTAAIVFFALLLSSPHYLMEAGFQLSFAAIFALLWWFRKYEFVQRTRMQKFWHGVKVLFQTTLVAEIATMPFVIWHFHIFPIMGLIGNMIFLPIFSGAIMPLSFIGHGELIYQPMLRLARTLPFASVQVPPIGPRPMFLTNHDNSASAVSINGKLHFSKNKDFAFKNWKFANGEAMDGPNPRWKCSRGLCQYSSVNWSVAYTNRFVPLLDIANLCAQGFVISQLPLTAPDCRVINGTAVIYENGRVRQNPERIWHKKKEL